MLKREILQAFVLVAVPMTVARAQTPVWWVGVGAGLGEANNTAVAIEHARVLDVALGRQLPRGFAVDVAAMDYRHTWAVAPVCLDATAASCGERNSDLRGFGVMLESESFSLARGRLVASVGAGGFRRTERDVYPLPAATATSDGAAIFGLGWVAPAWARMGWELSARDILLPNAPGSALNVVSLNLSLRFRP